MKNWYLMVAAMVAMVGSAQAMDVPAPAKVCAACHSFESGGPTKVGPNMFGIMGKPAGAVAGFKYSPEFLAAYGGKNWDAASMDAWIADSKGKVPQTKMVSKVADEANRKAIVEFLGTLK